MKKIFLLLFFSPMLCHAQHYDTTCKLDLYGCYVYALRALTTGGSGLDKMHDQLIKRKTKTIYIPKYFYTSGLPETIENYKLNFVTVDENKENIYSEVKAKESTLVYMSELSIRADTCDLWFMPISLKKTNGNIEPEYKDYGCHIFFQVCKHNGKLGYVKTYCPENKQ